MDNVLFQNETFTSKTIWPEKLMVMWIQVCSKSWSTGVEFGRKEEGCNKYFYSCKKKSCKYLLKHYNKTNFIFTIWICNVKIKDRSKIRFSLLKMTLHFVFEWIYLSSRVRNSLEWSKQTMSKINIVLYSSIYKQSL